MHEKVTAVTMAVQPSPQTRAATCLGWLLQLQLTTSPLAVTTSRRSREAAKLVGGEEPEEPTARVSRTVRSGTGPERSRQRWTWGRHGRIL